MSVQAITWALKQQVKSATHKAVLLVLANGMNENGYGWPSQKRIAREAQCSERTVRTVLKDLENAKILSRSDRRRKDGSFTSDSVQLSMPFDPAADIAADQPAANLAVGNSRRRQDTAQPAANLAGLTTFETNTTSEGSLRSPSEEPSKGKSAGKPAALPAQIEAYNVAAAEAGWIALRVFTAKRRHAARLAWKALGGEPGWLELIAAAKAQRFLGGENDRRWRMDFDFFVSERGRAHILEGKYGGPDVRPPDAAELERRLMLWRFDRTWAPSWGPPPSEANENETGVAA